MRDRVNHQATYLLSSTTVAFPPRTKQTQGQMELPDSPVQRSEVSITLVTLRSQDSMLNAIRRVFKLTETLFYAVRGAKYV
jgi:hypothetical protein